MQNSRQRARQWVCVCVCMCVSLCVCEFVRLCGFIVVQAMDETIALIDFNNKKAYNEISRIANCEDFLF